MENVKITNVMRVMRVNTVLDIEKLHQQFGGKLFRGRPEMLLLRMSNGRNVQLFRRGTIQILGRLHQREVEMMRREVLQCLQLRTVPPLVITNIVISAQLTKKKLFLRNMNDVNVFYETGLFPAALIHKWHPAHVAVFHNGKVILTGVKTVKKCHEIFTSLIHFLENK